MRRWTLLAAVCGLLAVGMTFGCGEKAEPEKSAAPAAEAPKPAEGGKEGAAAAPAAGAPAAGAPAAGAPAAGAPAAGAPAAGATDKK